MSKYAATDKTIINLDDLKYAVLEERKEKDNGQPDSVVKMTPVARIVFNETQRVEGCQTNYLVTNDIAILDAIRVALGYSVEKRNEPHEAQIL